MSGKLQRLLGELPEFPEFAVLAELPQVIAQKTNVPRSYISLETYFIESDSLMDEIISEMKKPQEHHSCELVIIPIKRSLSKAQTFDN